MDTLQDAYRDDNDTGEASTPSLAAAADGAESTDTIQAGAAAASDTNPESDHENGIKDESLTPAIEEFPSSDGINQSQDNDSHNLIDSHDSPNLPLVTDGDDDDDEEEEEEDEVEEPSPKKQKQLSDLPKSEPMELEITETPSPGHQITPLSQNGKPSAASTAKSSKKSKKKSKDVWVTTSRKGKKKTKHASNGDTNGHASKENQVFITPIPRFPDRNDDSPDLKICLSKVYKAEKVELSEDRLSAGSTKGYRMVRATRGVTEGAWYFEIKVVHLGETGHTRLGWSMEKGDLQASVGYDGHSFGYRDIDGSKVHKALRENYGEEGYKEGDVIGFYINLPDGGSYAPTPAPLVWYKRQRYVSAPGAKEDPPKVVPGSEISYYKNGIWQGVAFRDLYGGCYYPAASMYTLPNQPNCTVKFNFGPDFEMFPEYFGERPVPRPIIEVPYQSHDGRVENGTPWNMNRMCPTMFKVVNGE